MKFDISYVVYSTHKNVWYTEDSDLNFDGSPIEAQSEDEALIHFKEIITELMNKSIDLVLTIRKAFVPFLK